MTSEHPRWAPADREPSLITGSSRVVLHATRVGRYTLRTERELDTGQYFYYVDNVSVDINKYLAIVREYSAAHG